MDRANVVIIGGGVVGCAIALELSATIEDVFLLEQLPKLGMATSTRNSGVIHSGIYYPPGSLKARLCVEGNRLTKEFCATHGVPHENCGKLVVATHESQVAELERLAANGRNNGVEGLRIVGRERIREREPHVSGVAALEAPSTGIVLAEELTKGYARVAAERGANILTDARVTNLTSRADGIVVGVERGDPAEPERLARETIDGEVRGECRGAARRRGGGDDAQQHQLPHLPRCAANTPRSDAPGLSLVNSAGVSAAARADHLSLGMHLTRTLWGTVLVGPTARYVAENNT